MFKAIHAGKAGKPSDLCTAAFNPKLTSFVRFVEIFAADEN